MNDVEVMQVIRTNLKLRGNGMTGDPFRRVEQFWDFKGNLLAENDSYISTSLLKVCKKCDSNIDSDSSYCKYCGGIAEEEHGTDK